MRIADELPGDGCCLSGLQSLVGGVLSRQSAPADVILRRTEMESNFFRFEGERNVCSYFVKLSETEQEKLVIWRRSLLLSFAVRILRGEKIMPVHGCFLRSKNGNAFLLCGQSGMGKTTTANRWKAAGGNVITDDMILLEYGEDTLYAHPLPTWSRCSNSMEGEAVPFEDAVPLKAVLGLSRDEETESVRDVEGFKYMTAIYSACSLFNIFTVKNASSGQQERLTAAIKNCAVLLYDRFPHRTFFANLHSDITQTLGKELI